MYLHNKLGDEWNSYEDFEKYIKGKIEVFVVQLIKNGKNLIGVFQHF
jgi:hypothetical protein